MKMHFIPATVPEVLEAFDRKEMVPVETKVAAFDRERMCLLLRKPGGHTYVEALLTFEEAETLGDDLYHTSLELRP